MSEPAEPLQPKDGDAPYLQLLQLLQDHLVRHVVKEAVGGRDNDVTQLDVKGGAFGHVGAAERNRRMDSVKLLPSNPQQKSLQHLCVSVNAIITFIIIMSVFFLTHSNGCIVSLILI